MKIEVSKEAISEGIATIAPAISARVTIPVLGNLLLETVDGKVRLASTDMTVALKHTMDAKVSADGGITIPAKKFSEIVGSLGDSGISLTVQDDGKVKVQSGRARFMMVGTPISDYPPVADFNEDGAFRVPAEVISEAISKTLFAVCHDETRHNINGLNCSASGGFLTAVGTDGRRLAEIRRPGLPKDVSFNITLPGPILGDIAKMASKVDGDVMVRVTENQASFRFGETTLVTRLVAGTFPQYKQIITKEFATKFKVGSTPFMEVVRRAALASEKLQRIVLTIGGGALKVSAKGQTVEFDDEIPVEGGEQKVVVAFNPELLIDSLKASGGAAVEVGIGGDTKPTVIRVSGDDDYASVIMPMR